jgi:hypothetical protein
LYTPGSIAIKHVNDPETNLVGSNTSLNMTLKVKGGIYANENLHLRAKSQCIMSPMVRDSG